MKAHLAIVETIHGFDRLFGVCQVCFSTMFEELHGRGAAHTMAAPLE